MRELYPKEIRELIPIFAPYMIYTEKKGYILKEDAPENIVKSYSEAQKKLKEFRENTTHS